MTEAIIDRWILEADFPLLSDAIAEVVYPTPLADTKRREWTASTGEFVRRAGYSLLHLAASDPKNPISDDELVEYLHRVRDEIHESPNWSREMMNFAPVAIGRRSPALYDEALAAARAYGNIDVFHGDKTNCKISDAVFELENPSKRPVRKAMKATS